MGKYIKKFQSNSQRTTFEDSQNYIEPYVSFVNEDDSVHYNRIEEAIVVTCRDLESDTVNFLSPYDYFLFDQFKEKVEYIKIDGETILPENYSTYLTDASHSTHTVKIKLKEEYKNTLPWYIFKLTDIISVFLPDTIETFGTEAFYGCANLSEVTLSNNLIDISGSAFYNCNSLTSINIPSSVTTINSNAFQNCLNLTSVTISDGITNIGYQAFYGCTNLTSITLESETPPTLSSYPFDYYNQGYIILPNLSIYVPAESLEAYKSAWSRYSNIIFAAE